MRKGDATRPFPSGRYSLAIRIFVAIVLGVATGVWLGPKAEVLGELGFLVIKLLKALATPLVFFAILDTFFTLKIPAKKGKKLLLISGANALVAGAITLGIARLFPIGKYFDLAPVRAAMSGATIPAEATHAKLDLLATIKSFVPSSVVEPFVSNNVIAVILFAVLLGAVIRDLRDSGQETGPLKTVESFVSGCLALFTAVLKWIVKWIPLAVFGVIAKVVGSTGLGVFAILGIFVAVVMAGFVVHALVYYSILLLAFARKSPLRFFSEASAPLMTAFGTGSSLATLPVTLGTLQGPMKVSADSARLAACVGTNLNHDGILLYEATAALFVAQVFGIHLGVGDQLLLLLASTWAAIGIAGVPDAGLITLSLVLGAVGLPLSAVPFLLPVDWFVGRLRAVVNVTSDMLVAQLLDL